MSNQNFLNKPIADKIVLSFSVLLLIYWIVATGINVYSIAIVGAFFELTSIPMLCLLVVLPLLSILSLMQKRVSIKSLSIYSLLIILANILLLIFKK